MNEDIEDEGVNEEEEEDIAHDEEKYVEDEEVNIL